ncbi:hypothetical protein E2C01_016388 [Portunus trituberculatus]|uniref:Uncharacterized protein n=1 Tax=Portunus trituberculatus TaxID=210409 RepID=A0A5B7DQM2_PORTR|nr:hypothetical protein [Portunus trituberculatus]
MTHKMTQKDGIYSYTCTLTQFGGRFCVSACVSVPRPHAICGDARVACVVSHAAVTVEAYIRAVGRRLLR